MSKYTEGILDAFLFIHQPDGLTTNVVRVDDQVPFSALTENVCGQCPAFRLTPPEVRQIPNWQKPICRKKSGPPQLCRR